jgi:hypothetical protein
MHRIVVAALAAALTACAASSPVAVKRGTGVRWRQAGRGVGCGHGGGAGGAAVEVGARPGGVRHPGAAPGRPVPLCRRRPGSRRRRFPTIARTTARSRCSRTRRRPRCARWSRRRRRRRARLRFGCAEGRRLLRELHGRRSRRGAGRDAARGRDRADPADPHDARRVRLHGALAAARRAPSADDVRDAGRARFEGVHRLGVPERPDDAGPRLLPRDGRAQRRVAPRARRATSRACWRSPARPRPGPRRGASPRSRAASRIITGPRSRTAIR